MALAAATAAVAGAPQAEARALPASGLGQDVVIHYSKVTILFGFVFGS
jgi:hypothetical protein